jgi:dipeptidyl aminopeptidase/acylaminoacyl peptidase
VHGIRLAVVGCVVLALSALSGTRAVAQSRPGPDGRIVQQTRCATHDLPYAGYVSRVEAEQRAALATEEAWLRNLAKPSRGDTLAYEHERAGILAVRPAPRARYDSAFHGGQFECLRIRYLSDGLQVVGFIFRPTDSATATTTTTAATRRQYPVIIFNRGGSREFGKNREVGLIPLSQYLRAGFVVVASQYRGNDGGEGQEEYGGADVNDVLNLLPLIRSLPYADTANVFMYGGSRGGLMTYAALARGAAVNAAAVLAAPTDAESGARDRPGLVEEIIAGVPGAARDRAEFYRRRSPLRWAEQIRTPVLIFHGTADAQVNPRDALRMAERLQELGRPYGLIMYPGDDHSVSRNREDLRRHVIEWFRAHMKTPGGGDRAP